METCNSSTTDNFKVHGITEIKNRIVSANAESPIAVFTVVRNDVKSLSSVFAETIYTRQLIKDDHPDLVGVFHSYSDLKKVKVLLDNALK